MLTTDYTSEIQNAITLYANDGVELYKRLKSIHTQAWQAGDSIVYPGGKTINITVCLNDSNAAQVIPLSDNTNFRGCTFNVTNNTTKEFYLFSLKPSSTPNNVTLSKEQLKKYSTIFGP